MKNGILDSGQKIITNGLVLNYDVAQLRSYPKIGTNITDLSGNGNNGTLINGVIFNSSNGGILQFDGVNDYIQSTNPSNLKNQNFTISLWVYPKANTKGLVTLLDYNHASGANWVIQSEDAVTNKYYYLAYYSVSAFQPSNGFGAGKGIKITNDIWQNIIYVKNGLNVKGYLNGVLNFDVNASSSTVTYSATPNLTLSILAGTVNRSSNNNTSQLQIYNRALTATEVLQNFNANRSRYGL